MIDEAGTDGDPLQGLRSVEARILACAKGRRVVLVAVSKMKPPSAVRALLEGGHRIFGENRVQEAAGKYPELRSVFPDLELHLIGPLQSNKTREAVALFDVIETLDRPKLAQALAAEIARAGRAPRLLIQVNTGEEPQKAGIAPRDLDGFLKLCRDLKLEIEGLMCIPPIDQDPAPHFETLAGLAKSNGLQTLSMGMSGDFETAIALGASHVRIGTAVFGTR